MRGLERERIDVFAAAFVIGGVVGVIAASGGGHANDIIDRSSSIPPGFELGKDRRYWYLNWKGGVAGGMELVFERKRRWGYWYLNWKGGVARGVGIGVGKEA